MSELPWHLQMQREHDDGTYPKGFFIWLEANREVFREFCRVALRAKDKGYARWSAFAIINIIRWESPITEKGTAEVKISNNAAPGMARLSMALIPKLAGFFATHSKGRHDGIPLA